MNTRRYGWPLIFAGIILGVSMYLYADIFMDSPDGYRAIWEESVESNDGTFSVETGIIPVNPELTPVLRVSNNEDVHMEVAVYRETEGTYRILGRDPGVTLEFHIMKSSSLSLLFNGTIDTLAEVNIMVGHIEAVSPFSYYMNGSILKPIGIACIIACIASGILIKTRST